MSFDSTVFDKSTKKERFRAGHKYDAKEQDTSLMSPLMRKIRCGHLELQNKRQKTPLIVHDVIFYPWNLCPRYSGTLKNNVLKGLATVATSG